MIDLHCHILPAIDDGSKSMDESVIMCQQAVNDGIHTIVATPHRGSSVANTTAQQVFDGIKKLKEVLKQKQIDIDILPGHENHIYKNLIEDIDQNQALTINHKKKYILLELPFQSVPFYVFEIIEQLFKKGIKSIIAHPERNTQIQMDKRIIKKFIKAGALFQITGSSLSGQYGVASKRIAQELLKNNFVHIIASDAHSSKKRTPVLSDSVTEAAKIVGKKQAMALVEENPRYMME